MLNDLAAKISILEQRIIELEQEKRDLEISLDVTTEHADAFEQQLLDIRQTLEDKVKERTQALAKNNIHLKREIQERKQVELALLEAKELSEAANNAKSAFMANMSHELRTPLNAIIGYSELLMDDCGSLIDAEVCNDLKRIHLSGTQLLNLVNDVLDISKIEAGKVELYLECFDLVQMLNDVIALLEPLVTKSGNQLYIDFEQDRLIIHSDITKMRQILFNLINNAIKFTNNGKININVWQLNSQQIQIDVKDTGIGISEAQQQKLFVPFNQADNSTTRKYGGTGLGLVISLRFAEMMGGKIEIKSKKGSGSTFSLITCINLKKHIDNKVVI